MTAKRGKTMKFIKLRHGNDEKITYTVRVDSISCIETSANREGEIFTWIYSKDYETGQFWVKETEDEILQMIKGVEKLSCLS